MPAERRAQQRMSEQRIAPGGEEVVHQEEKGHLEQRGQTAGQRGGAVLRIQVGRRLLEPLRLALVLALELGELRGERGARLLATGRGAGERMQRGAYGEGEQDDGGGRGRGTEQRCQGIGDTRQPLAENAENGHG